MYASSYVLVMTALDRYLAICYPLTAHTWTSKKMHSMVAVAWLLSLIFATPQLFIFSYREITPDSGVYDCWAEFRWEWAMKAYISWITVAIYIVPFLILTLCYGRICYVVWQSMHMKGKCQQDKISYRNTEKENGSLLRYNISMMDNGNADNGLMKSKPRTHVKGVSKAKLKTVKLTMTVIICYLLCWGPFFIAQMWAAWDINAPFTGKEHSDNHIPWPFLRTKPCFGH